MGEGFGIYSFAEDSEIMPFIDAANVACGFHASDPNTMRKTVELAKKHNVKVGSHPAYPDLVGFGRRPMKMQREEIKNLVNGVKEYGYHSTTWNGQDNVGRDGFGCVFC